MLRAIAILLACGAPVVAGVAPTWPAGPGVVTQDGVVHHEDAYANCFPASWPSVFHATLVAGAPSDEVLFLLLTPDELLPVVVRLGEPTSVEYVAASSCPVFDAIGRRVAAAAAYEAHVDWAR